MLVTALGMVILGVVSVPVALVTGQYYIALGLPVGIALAAGIAYYAVNHAD
jgi:hypothetical protein